MKSLRLTLIRHGLIKPVEQINPMTFATVQPPKRPASFNAWQKGLQKDLDKIRNTQVVSKIDWR